MRNLLLTGLAVAAMSLLTADSAKAQVSTFNLSVGNGYRGFSINTGRFYPNYGYNNAYRYRHPANVYRGYRYPSHVYRPVPVYRAPVVRVPSYGYGYRRPYCPY